MLIMLQASTVFTVMTYRIRNGSLLYNTQQLDFFFFSIGQVDGKLVTVGGKKQNKIISNNMSFYNQHTGKWTNKYPMPTARQQPTVISQPTCLIVAGGFTSVTSTSCYDCTNVVEVFSISTSQWTQVDSLPIACGYQSGGVTNGMVYLIGGNEGTSRLQKTFVTSLDKLLAKVPNTLTLNIQESSTDLDASPWSEATDTPAYDSSAFVTSEMVLALGGAASADLTVKRKVRTIYAYSITMNSWIHVGELPVALSGACVVAISAVEFLVIGGVEDSSTRTHEYTRTVYKGTIAAKIN